MAGLEPSNLEFTIERTDGIDVDSIVASRLRRWYVEQLHTAPTEFLPIEDIAALAILKPGMYSSSQTVILPDGCLRPQSISFENWLVEVPVAPEERFHDIVAAQDNPYLAATDRYPSAVCCPGQPNRIVVFPGGEKVTALKAVKDPGDGLFVLDEALLNHLPVSDIFNQL